MSSGPGQYVCNVWPQYPRYIRAVIEIYTSLLLPCVLKFKTGGQGDSSTECNLFSGEIRYSTPWSMQIISWISLKERVEGDVCYHFILLRMTNRIFEIL